MKGSARIWRPPGQAAGTRQVPGHTGKPHQDQQGTGPGMACQQHSPRKGQGQGQGLNAGGQARGQRVHGARLQMSLRTAPHHKLAACSDGTHLDQEVKLPKVFGLWYKRTAPDETWVKDLFRAQIIFPPICATPNCARHLLARSHPREA